MIAAKFNFSMLLYEFCRMRLQNWIGVVADKTATRYLFITGPAPVSGRPKPGKDTRAHMPCKSGVAACVGVTINVASAKAIYILGIEILR
jgi:hypothetical protein